MKIKKIVIIAVVIVGIVGMYYADKNKEYQYKIYTIKQNIKNNKLSDAETNIKNFGLKEKDAKELNDKVKILKAKIKKENDIATTKSDIVAVKKDIETNLESLKGLDESDAKSFSALDYAFNGYVDSISSENINECKRLGIQNYLLEMQKSYLKYISVFNINKTEAIRLSKVDRLDRLDIYSKNKVVDKWASEDTEADIKRDAEKEANRTPPRIGMTEDDLGESSWGQPEDVNTTTTAYGSHTQYCYSGNKYVYVEDGVVTTIQD